MLLLSRIITKLSTKQADLSFAFDDAENLQTKEMTTTEMQETEGAVAPLVAVGVMMGTRFIAQRWVTQKVAQNMVKRGATNIMAPNRSVAKKLQETIPSENITLALVQDIPIIIRTQEMALIFGMEKQDN